jgi:hypothetical protein
VYLRVINPEVICLDRERHHGTHHATTSIMGKAFPTESQKAVFARGLARDAARNPSSANEHEAWRNLTMQTSPPIQVEQPSE